MRDVFDIAQREKLKPKPVAKTWDNDERGFERQIRNPEFVGHAFNLFCKGMSLPNVAKAMKASGEWPDVSLRSLQRVAKDNDWIGSRAAVLAIHTDAQKQAEGIIPECVMQLQRLRIQFEGRTLVDHKEISVYRKLVEDLMMYTGQHPKLKNNVPLAVSSEAEVQALLKAISEDDAMSGIWKKRRPYIEKAYKRNLVEMARDKSKMKK